jgi:hypothetical protein
MAVTGFEIFGPGTLDYACQAGFASLKESFSLCDYDTPAEPASCPVRFYRSQIGPEVSMSCPAH